MNRSAYLDYCKKRALEYTDMSRCLASFVSDMNKHSDTANHSALPMGMQLIMNGSIITIEQLHKWINDFG